MIVYDCEQLGFNLFPFMHAVHIIINTSPKWPKILPYSTVGTCSNERLSAHTAAAMIVYISTMSTYSSSRTPIAKQIFMALSLYSCSLWRHILQLNTIAKTIVTLNVRDNKKYLKAIVTHHNSGTGVQCNNTSTNLKI